MKAIERYFFGGVDPIRPWLLLRLLLLVLAFDCWVDLVPHGGRYGFNDFNVAHFAILDWVLPTPSSGLYVGVVLLTGLLACVQAITRPTRIGVAAVFATYTYGWLMSMLDSYQHHYLISVLLFSCIFFPMPTGGEVFERSRPSSARAWGGLLVAWSLLEVVLGLCGVDSPLSMMFGPGAKVGIPGWVWGARVGLGLLGALLAFLPGAEEAKEEAKEPEPEPEPEPRPKKKKKKKKRKGKKAQTEKPKPQPKEKPKAEPKPVTTTSAWAYVSFCVSCAIVYFYTAVTKLSPDWRDGHALRRLSRTELLDAFESQALQEGLPLFGQMSADGFWRMVAGGAILVQIVSCVGFLMAAAIDRASVRIVGITSMMVLAPLSFHLGAEAGLGLDIGWFSFYMLLISIVVFAPAPMLRLLAERFSAAWESARTKWSGAMDVHAGGMHFVLVAAVATTLGAGWSLDLPGSLGASIVMAVALIASVLVHARRERKDIAREHALGGLIAALLFWTAVAQSDVRFDFYRFVGGEYRRHQEPALALEAYEKANRYVVAPWCVYEGTGRRRELLECYRSERRAEEVATAHGLSFERRDRSSQEEEMRRIVEQDGG